MIAKVESAICIGIDTYPIEIEIDLINALPQITVVGLPDQAVKESKDRIKSAIKNSGFKFPSGKIVINLAPADIKKEGPIFDLPIALGILAAAGHVNKHTMREMCIIGELALNGAVRQTNGALPIALGMQDIKKLVLPSANAKEAVMQNHVCIFAVRTLREAVDFINGDCVITAAQPSKAMFHGRNQYSHDFTDVQGQYHAKRAVEIAVSGAHNIIMIGPPGSGKTMLARRIPSILPDLTHDEALEIMKIYSAYGLSYTAEHGVQRPFRNPHHTASSIALIGGGSIPKPGEVSLAHNGVLFLDEVPEFNRSVLEVLRCPLEDAYVTVTRAKQALTFPANFMLVCAMNPCPCVTERQLNVLYWKPSMN